MDFIGGIISGLILLFLSMTAVWFIATNTGLALVIVGVVIGLGALCWPLIRKLL